MASATPLQSFTELRFIRSRASAIRAAIEAAGASAPRIIGAVARGEDTGDRFVTFLVDSQPSLSLFSLVEVEEKLSIMLDRHVELWCEGAFRSEERARYVAEAVPL